MSEPDRAPYRLEPARIPLLIDVPHAGTGLPAELAQALTPEAARFPDTDWHVDRLYEFASAAGAGRMTARLSRYVVDLNRHPQGIALYPGADNTELVPLKRFDGGPIWQTGFFPDAAEVARRRAAYWQPYHERLEAEIQALKARFGYVILLDAHSIPAQVPRFFQGRLPDLNLGTADGQSAQPSLIDAAWKVVESAPGFSAIRDGRFKGGYITRHYGRPAEGVHALQLEIVQASYMDEADPTIFDVRRANPLIGVLERLVDALSSWRP
ncbi:MAG: N-formylglutamate deformylase [Rhodospirillales bacterium]|nr:N-formylglutamate deformylase [Rhodospirillales bacterium]